MGKTFLSIGEAMIEMSAGDGDNWRMGFAGDTFNTAWYARTFLDTDWEVAYFTALGVDRYSGMLRDFFAASGIETRYIATVEDRRPGLYFIHQEHGDRQFTYWRDTSAARLLARDEAALSRALGEAELAYFSGITLAILDDADRARFFAALRKARAAGVTICFDPNIRPSLWRDKAALVAAVTEAGGLSDIVLPTHGDEAPLFGDADNRATAERYAALGVGEVVVKNGGDPVLIRAGGEEISVPAGPVEKVVDATGAGDSFNGAYLVRRLMGDAPRVAAEKAHRVAGICIGHHGALAPREAVLAATRS